MHSAMPMVDDADDERDPAAHDDAAEHVAAEIVGAASDVKATGACSLSGTTILKGSKGMIQSAEETAEQDQQHEQKSREGQAGRRAAGAMSAAAGDRRGAARRADVRGLNGHGGRARQ